MFGIRDCNALVMAAVGEGGMVCSVMYWVSLRFGGVEGFGVVWGA